MHPPFPLSNGMGPWAERAGEQQKDRQTDRERDSVLFSLSATFNPEPPSLRAQILLAFGGLVGIGCMAVILQVGSSTN